ncbi:hypothetical protein [Nonomuraea aurantiaca]|uniref:hypothetical protein n=1 Tax=Nonomuraea aurantiaca TaxID=2878562 RepID=UPI001CD9E46B|nr:hypothetical protein [Nonomuraea aurantiaca]MCA2222942.1 hypothetical protein [Nonomuraea aurantiaca]
MPVAGAIAVIVFGAILTFALADGSVGGVDLRIVGVVLMLGGGVGLLLPLLLRTRSRWSQSTVRSRQDVIDDRVNGRTAATAPIDSQDQSAHRYIGVPLKAVNLCQPAVFGPSLQGVREDIGICRRQTCPR